MDLRDELANAVGATQAFVVDVYSQQSQLAVETYVALVLLGGVVFLAYLYENYRKEQRKLFLQQRGEKMTRSERQQYVNVKVADAITDALLDLEVKGQLCTAEVAHYSKKMARAMKLQYELLPRHTHPNEARISKGVYLKIEHKPNIPGSKDNPLYPEPKKPGLFTQSFGNVSKFFKPKAA